jgi:hypothetical protein
MEFILHLLGACTDNHTHIDMSDILLSLPHTMKLCVLYINQVLLYLRTLKTLIS